MGILSDMETTIMVGNIHNIKINMFNTILTDSAAIMNRSLNSYYLYSAMIYRRNLYSVARKISAEIKLYDLIDHFELSGDDIKALFESEYITQTNTYIMDGHHDLDVIIKIKQNESINIIYNINDYVNTQLKNYIISDENKSIFKYKFKKQILNIPITINDNFWTEFDEYLKTRIVDK